VASSGDVAIARQATWGMSVRGDIGYSMKEAIFHVGLHKTGTTFLQTCMRRSLAANDRLRRKVFFSSQHSECGDWKTLRSGAFARIRHTLLKSMTTHGDHDGLMRALAENNLLEREILELSAHLNRDADVFFHSDENTIGAPFGHSFQSPILDYPFYPGAEMITGLLLETAARLYDRMTVVITFRDFGDYVESSLKDAVVYHLHATGGRKAMPLPKLDLLRCRMGIIDPRMRQIIEYVGNVPCLDRLLLVDYNIIKTDPADYVAKVCGNVFDQIDRPEIVPKIVNPSISNAEAIEAYLSDQPELRESPGSLKSDEGLLSSAERFALTQDTIRFTQWAENEQNLNPKLSVIR
jgi:hypothetical protein